MLQKLSQRHRAPAPALSPGQLNAAKSIAAIEVGFLTPPISSPNDTSPPPRAGAGDDPNEHRSRRHWKARHPRQSRKHHSAYAYSEDVSPSERSSLSPPGSRSQNDRCESCNSLSVASNVGSAAGPLLFTGLKGLNLPSSNYSDRPTNIRSDTVIAKPSLSPALGVEESDTPESLAVLSLRSLTMSRPENENGEPRNLRRMSSALSSTFNFLKTRSPTTKFPSKFGKQPEEGQRQSEPTENDNLLARQKSNSCYPTFRGSRGLPGLRGTPSTITLRKASNVYASVPVMSSMGASIINEGIRKTTAEAPASELLAFYSTPIPTNRGKKLTDHTLPGDASPSSVQTERSSETEIVPVQKRSMSIMQFNQKLDTRLTSNPPDPTITFADVFVAPGSFAIEPNSRKASLIPGEALRRISVVHFKSRYSIHEIIWREDETTSGSSLASGSRSSTSPERDVSVDQSESPTSEERPPGSQTGRDKPDAEYEYFSLSPTPSPHLSKHQSAPLQWPWRILSAEGNNQDEPLDVMKEAAAQGTARSNSDPGVPGLHILRETHSQNIRRVSTDGDRGIPDIQSFRPFRSRSSTSEWQKAPLVDIHDPFAGRIQHFQEQENDDSTGYGSRILGLPIVTGKSEQIRKQSAGRKLSSHTFGPPIMSPTGRMGSMVGASSHMRVVHEPRS